MGSKSQSHKSERSNNLNTVLLSCLSLTVSLIDEFGAEGFSGAGPSHGGSFRQDPILQSFEDQGKNLGPGPAPVIGFTPGPASGTSGPTTTNYNNIHIPPGAHAPANTPAELPPPTGMKKERFYVCVVSFKIALTFIINAVN